jgi:hypothetical protein
VPFGAVVLDELNPRLFERFNFGLLELGAAHRVHDDVHLHALPGPLRERRDELGAELAGTEDEVLERNGFPGAANGFELRRKNLITVDQGRDLVAGQKRGADQMPDGFAENRIRRGVSDLDWFLDSFLDLPRHEHNPEQRDDDQHHNFPR